MAAHGTHLSVGFNRPINAFIPPVYRFLDQRYADELISTGRLRLSTFAAFGKHTDEERLDKREGYSSLFGHSAETNKTFVVGRSVGMNAYVLSVSGRSDKTLATQFGADSCIEISNALEFAAMVGGEIPGFQNAFFGPCVYQERRLFQQAIGKFELSDLAVSAEDPTTSVEKVMQKASELGGPIEYFLKLLRYAHQIEYRFIWFTNKPVLQPYFDIENLDMRKICRLVAWTD
jgi:hypothetical protein